MKAEHKIAVLDNYDSFTYNLVHLIKEVSGIDPAIYRNDEVTVAQLEVYSHIILSPGPGIPDEAGILKDVIKKLGDHKKILGVCLGLQAIGEVYGSTLRNLDLVYHGKKSLIKKTDSNDLILAGIANEFYAGRYHSWVITRQCLGEDLIITCEDEQGEIMGIRHKYHQVYGLQFHPESIMTDYGQIMMRNFLDL